MSQEILLWSKTIHTFSYSVRASGYIICYRSELFIPLFFFSNLIERNISIFPGKYFFVFVLSYTSLSSTPFVFKEIWAP